MMRRRTRLLAIGPAVALLFAGALFATRFVVAGDSGGDFHVVRLHAPAPPFEIPPLRDGQSRVVLSELVDRPLVMNFWASWCVPCRKEMKGFEAVHEQLGNRVTFLGVDTKDDRADALAFAARVGVTYALAFDPEGTLASRFDAVGLPTTIFIDARGMMLERRLGAMSQAELQSTIDKLLRP